MDKIKIAFVGQPEYFRMHYENDLSTEYEVKEFPFMFCHSDLFPIKRLSEFAADITFFFRGEHFPDKFIDRISGIKVALSSEQFPNIIDSKLNYTIGSLKQYFDFRKQMRHKDFDYIFHYDESSIDFFKKDGMVISGAFPLPIATDTYAPQHGHKKIWDIFFIGRSTPYREYFFGRLKHRYKFLHICHGIYGPPLVDYICKSKISVNVHVENKISWEPRVQMLLSCAAFVVSEPISLNKILRPGIDYVEAKNEKEMFEIIEHYLNNDDKRDSVAMSGYARINDLLSSKRAFSSLIKGILDGKFENSTQKKGECALILHQKYFEPSLLLTSLKMYHHKQSSIIDFQDPFLTTFNWKNKLLKGNHSFQL